MESRFLWVSERHRLGGVALLGDPTRHVSTGIHQTYGQCGVKARDYTGATRDVFLCAEAYSEPFAFACGGVMQAPAEGSEWYTVCGTTHPEGWVRGVLAMLLVTLAVYGAALGAGRSHRY